MVTKQERGVNVGSNAERKRKGEEKEVDVFRFRISS